MTGGKRCYFLAGYYRGSDDSKEDSAFIHFKPHNFSMRCWNSCFAYLVLIMSQPRVITRFCLQNCRDKARYLNELCGSSTQLLEKRNFRNALKHAVVVSLLFLLSTHHALSAEEPWPAGRLMAFILFGHASHLEGSQGITWSKGTRAPTFLLHQHRQSCPCHDPGAVGAVLRLRPSSRSSPNATREQLCFHAISWGSSISR